MDSEYGVAGPHQAHQFFEKLACRTFAVHKPAKFNFKYKCTVSLWRKIEIVLREKMQTKLCSLKDILERALTLNEHK